MAAASVNGLRPMGLHTMLNVITFTDISGVPGTGKTATVHAVVKELKAMTNRNVHAIPGVPLFITDSQGVPRK